MLLTKVEGYKINIKSQTNNNDKELGTLTPFTLETKLTKIAPPWKKKLNRASERPL